MLQYAGLVIVILLAGWYIGHLLSGRKVAEPKKLNTTPTAPQILENYKSLSFIDSKSIKSAFGQEIKLVGVGSYGVTLDCYIDQDVNFVNGLVTKVWSGDSKGRTDHWTMDWESFVLCFPDYRDEVLKLSDPNYKIQREAEEEYQQLLGGR